MTDVDKRAFVAALSPRPGWKRKVAGMGEPQVIAIYLREKAKAQSPPKPKPKESGDDIPF